MRKTGSLYSISGFLVLTAMALPACQQQGMEETAPQGAGDDRATARETSIDWGQANMVDVELTEFKINMPAELPAGPTMFHVHNAGNAVHNIEVEGQGIEKELESNLEPGGKATLNVNLKPGEYRVYCPVGNHAQRGMDMTLTVTG